MAPELTADEAALALVNALRAELRAGLHHERPPVEPEWISLSEFATRIGISQPTITRWVARGSVKTTKAGRRRLVHVSELERFATGSQR